MKVTRLFWMLCLLCLSLLPVAAQQAAPQNVKALLLFGGEDHKTFLGCLNCSELSKASVCNQLGKYGSSLQADSIWNSFGTFGSSFSKDSPWNSFSNSAPIIVDPDGNSYGYFSVNGFHHDRTRIGWLVAVLDYQEKNGDLDKTRDKICGD